MDQACQSSESHTLHIRACGRKPEPKSLLSVLWLLTVSHATQICFSHLHSYATPLKAASKVSVRFLSYRVLNGKVRHDSYGSLRSFWVSGNFFWAYIDSELVSPKFGLTQRLHQGKARTRILRGECRIKQIMHLVSYIVILYVCPMGTS